MLLILSSSPALNSPFFPLHIGDEPGRAKLKRVQDNLHSHAQSETIKNYYAVVDKSPYQAAHANVSHNTFFSSRSEKKTFFDRRCAGYCGKKQLEMWFIVVCTLSSNDYASLLFSQTFFSYCFCMLREFAKVFEGKSDAYK